MFLVLRRFFEVLWRSKQNDTRVVACGVCLNLRSNNISYTIIFNLCKNKTAPKILFIIYSLLFILYGQSGTPVPYNPSVTAAPRHLPLHKGGKGKPKYFRKKERP